MRWFATLPMVLCAAAHQLGAQQRQGAPTASVATPAARAADTLRFAAVTYISGQSVYISAGRLDGVREGMLIEELHAGNVVVIARTMFLSSHSSACQIAWSSAAPTVGDTVRFRPAKDQPAVASADSTPRAVQTPTRYSASWNRPLRGRVGIRYLSVSLPNASGSATSYAQPSADVYVQGTGLLGGLVGFTVDGRSRRTIGSAEAGASALDQRTLIYGASVSLSHPESGARVTIGRQYSAPLASVGLFDGVTAELNRSRWGVGLFSAAQPDAATMQFSSAVRESGGWVQVHSRPEGTMPWSFSTGAIESSDLGQFNREFGFAQFLLANRFVAVYAMQEVDVNRDWKRAAGDPAVSPTSTFASVSVRPIEALSINAGVDNRRNVLLYRDYVNPVTTFDDAFRQGVWGGATYAFLPTFQVGADVRVSRGGIAGAADSYTASFSAGPFLSQRVEARLRSTSYRTDDTGGWLAALSAGIDPIEPLHLELEGGVRTQRAAGPLGSSMGTALVTDGAQSWFGASVDVSLGRSWFVTLSATRDNAGPDLTNLLYSSIAYRF